MSAEAWDFAARLRASLLQDLGEGWDEAVMDGDDIIVSGDGERYRITVDVCDEDVAADSGAVTE